MSAALTVSCENCGTLFVSCNTLSAFPTMIYIGGDRSRSSSTRKMFSNSVAVCEPYYFTYSKVEGTCHKYRIQQNKHNA